MCVEGLEKRLGFQSLDKMCKSEIVTGDGDAFRRGQPRQAGTKPGPWKHLL